MYSLTSLRKQLRPVYGHYADAVISMIGCAPTQEVLDVVKKGDLQRAHLLQIMHNGSLEERSQHPRWNETSSVPKWIKRPVPRVRNKPELVVKARAEFPIYYDFFFESKKIWEAVIAVSKAGRGNVLKVAHLQQFTRHLSSNEARKVEGWKNSAMEEIEKIARQNNCRLIQYSAGWRHSVQSISPTPIHEELLETYGRLPIQHGYKLREIAPRHVERLWWVKRVR